jgi:DNA invertase Pin-like site-specific DNA recombinase
MALLSIISFLGVLGRYSVSYFWLLALPLLASVIQTDLYGFPSEHMEPSKRGEPNSQEYQVEELVGGKGIGAAAYLRVSTDKQAEKGFSLQDQELRLADEARRLGVSHLYKIADAGESGTDFTRRGLNKILELAGDGKIQYILVTSLDRIGRDLIESLDYVRKLRGLGVKIIASGSEADIATEEGLMTAAMYFLMAELEGKRITQRSASGRIQSFRMRHWSKPRPPIGYRKRGDGWIEREPGWEHLVKRVYELYLKNANYQIVRSIVNREFQAFLKKPLTHQQIRQVICDPVYAGKPQYAGKATVEDPSLAYIDPETFSGAQEISGRIRRKRLRKKKDALHDLLEKYGPDVLEFIPDVAVLCPDCKGAMVRNGTFVTREWVAHNYLCKKCGRQRKIPTKHQMRGIQEWVQKEGLNSKEVNRDLGI